MGYRHFILGLSQERLEKGKLYVHPDFCLPHSSLEEKNLHMKKECGCVHQKKWAHIVFPLEKLSGNCSENRQPCITIRGLPGAQDQNLQFGVH